jgi:transposase
MRTRRQFTAEFKAQRVLEVLSGRKTAAAMCREYQLKPDLLTRWKADFVTRAAIVFAGDEASQQAERRIAERRIAELERMVGRLTVELDVAKKALLLSYQVRFGPRRL